MRIFLGISCVLLPLMMAAQCDDPTPPTASMSVEVQSDCSGTAEVLLSFTITSDDDDDETYEIQYQIAGVTYTLANAVSGLVVSHTVTASTNAILQRLTAFEDDDDDDICVVNLNQVVFIDVNLPPFLTITSISEPTCGFTNGSITVNATDGTPPYQYRLNGQSFQSNTTFTDLGPGNYTITVRDANGCEDLVQESLSDAQAPTVVVSNSQMPDSGQNNGSITVMASGGSPPYEYSLNGQSFQSNTTFTGLGAGSYSITVRDANGCEDTVTGNLSTGTGVLSLQVLDIENPDCGEASGVIMVNATGGTPPYLYLINGQGAQNSPTFTNLPAGSYTITVQDANGLQSSIVGMLEDSVPEVVAENDGPVTVASTLSAALLISVLDNDEWEGNSVEVTLLQNPLLGSATVDVDNQIAYLPFPNLVGTDSLVYMVCDSQCLDACDTAVVYLLLEPQVENDCDLDYIPPDVVFPQGLTPNNDGWNDVLIFEIVDEIGCPSNYANSDITIFNRWGQRVFVQEPYLNNWAGQTLDGKDLPAGVYYYTLRIKRQNREDYLYFGDVSIFR